MTTYWIFYYFFLEKPKQRVRTPSPEPRDQEEDVVQEEEEEEVLIYLDDAAVAFKRKSGKSLQVSSQELNDDFFDLTIEDAKRIQVGLKLFNFVFC